MFGRTVNPLIDALSKKISEQNKSSSNTSDKGLTTTTTTPSNSWVDLPQYTRTPKYKGSWEGRSHSNRSAENVWQQTALDNLMDFAKDSGLGTWAASDASKASHWPSNNRSHGQRYQENVWQQHQISDLEKWAAAAYPDVPFTKTPLQNNQLRWQERSHNDRYAENRWQQDAIVNLQDWLEEVGKHHSIGAEEYRAAEAAQRAAEEEARRAAEAERLKPKEIDLSKYVSKEQYDKDLAASKSSWADDYASQLKRAKDEWSTQFDTARSGWDTEKQDLIASLTDTFKTEQAAKDRVYDTQIGELKSLYSTAQSSWDTQMGQYEDQITGLGSSLTDAINQIGGLSSTIRDQQSTIGEIDAARTEQAGQIRAYKEQAIRDAERARVAANYGSAGRPLNQQVKGVRTQDELPTSKPKFRSNFFGRTGTRIKNTSLNIA